MSRAEEAARRAELAANQERGESRQAQVLVDAFVRDARARGIVPEPLRATLFDGRSVKTDKVGWYLRKNKSLAVGEDGRCRMSIGRSGAKGDPGNARPCSS